MTNVEEEGEEHEEEEEEQEEQEEEEEQNENEEEEELEEADLGPEDDDEEEDAVACVICYEKTSIPAKRITGACAHATTICARCVRRHIHEELRGKNQVTRIPGGECGAHLEYNDVNRQASPDDFEFYDRLLTTRALEAMTEFAWCATRGCGNGQLHDGAHRSPIMTCHACGGKTCFTHRCVWHAGQTCEQYDAEARRSDEVALLQVLERNEIKRCPRCKHGIEKNAGCDHMTCRTSAGGCGYEFCWLCLADYEAIRRNGNAAHNPTCRYHF
eukprot:GGOE01061406.1.p2 GENE.GGOE01061406.1~~GGOE01061406.1.p2  ORF type:complete len:313 (-),score=91.48 GGOE01061406.1:159-974(-)